MLVADRYLLGERLGRGAAGEVWRATDQALSRPVAVKLLLGEADAAEAERFRLEARTTARLNHPHIVAVYDYGAHEGCLYLVMELIDGPALSEKLAAHGPLGPQRVAEIGAQAAGGLVAAHRQGIVHRGIKPANLMLTADGAVKITDFGITRFADPSGGHAPGSGAYLAPERARGKPAVPASDVYSLGCVLYELLTGELPAAPGATSTGRHRNASAATSVERLRTQVPHPLAEVIGQLLAEERTRRPTAERTTALLAGAARHRPPPPPPAYAPAVPAPAPTPSAHHRVLRRFGRADTWSTRARIAAVAGGAAVFAVSVPIGMALGSTDSPSTPPATPRPAGTAPAAQGSEPDTGDEGDQEHDNDRSRDRHHD